MWLMGWLQLEERIETADRDPPDQAAAVLHLAANVEMRKALTRQGAEASQLDGGAARRCDCP